MLQKKRENNMLILLSFLVSIDSFFISSLTSGRAKSNIILIVFSPLLHTLLCFAGIMIHKDIIPPYKNHLILLYLFIILMVLSGIYLYSVYDPQQKTLTNGKSNRFISIKSMIIIIILLYCSFDAAVAGIVFAYWNIPVTKSMFAIYSINLVLVLLPIIFKQIRKNIKNEPAKKFN